MDSGRVDAAGLDGGPIVPEPDGGRDGGRDAGATDAGRLDAGPPDAGPACDTFPCQLVSPQCGCASGQGCYREASGPTTCVTAGTGAAGTACTTSTDCQPGHICTGQPQGGCWRLCNTDADCIGTSQCVYPVRDMDNNVVPGPEICSANCNPVTNADCPAGWACTIEHDVASEYTYCRRPGSVGKYGTCTEEYECVQGHACLPATGGGSRCFRWCSAPGSQAECASGETCTSYSLVGTTPYGVCTVD